MDPKVQQQIIDGLKELAQKLGVGAEALWGMFVRQVFITGIECAIASAMALILFPFALRSCQQRLKEAQADEFNEFPGRFLFFGLVSIACTVIFAICLIDAIDLLGNPGYWAFVDLRSRI